jgi:hypothetical protein
MNKKDLEQVRQLIENHSIETNLNERCRTINTDVLKALYGPIVSKVCTIYNIRQDSEPDFLNICYILSRLNCNFISHMESDTDYMKRNPLTNRNNWMLQDIKTIRDLNVLTYINLKCRKNMVVSSMKFDGCLSDFAYIPVITQKDPLKMTMKRHIVNSWYWKLKELKPFSKMSLKELTKENIVDFSIAIAESIDELVIEKLGDKYVEFIPDSENKLHKLETKDQIVFCPGKLVMPRHLIAPWNDPNTEDTRINDMIEKGIPIDSILGIETEFGLIDSDGRNYMDYKSKEN